MYGVFTYIFMEFMIILLMEEILHQWIGIVSPIIYGGLDIPGGWEWDFWTINSITPRWLIFISVSCINCRIIENQLPRWQSFLFTKADCQASYAMMTPFERATKKAADQQVEAEMREEGGGNSNMFGIFIYMNSWFVL